MKRAKWKKPHSTAQYKHLLKEHLEDIFSKVPISCIEHLISVTRKCRDQNETEHWCFSIPKGEGELETKSFPF